MATEQQVEVFNKELTEQKNAAQNQAATMHVSKNEITVKVDDVNFVRLSAF